MPPAGFPEARAIRGGRAGKEARRRLTGGLSPPKWRNGLMPAPADTAQEARSRVVGQLAKISLPDPEAAPLYTIVWGPLETEGTLAIFGERG